MLNQPLEEIDFPKLGFKPCCLTTWRRREMYLRVISTNPTITEVHFGTPKRKVREIQFVKQLEDLYLAIYDEKLT